MFINKDLIHKTGLLLIALTLTISTAAALQWTEDVPEENNAHDSLNLSVSASEGFDGDVKFYINPENGNTYDVDTESNNDSLVYWQDFSAVDFVEADFYAYAPDSDSEGNTSTRTFIIDEGSPNLDDVNLDDGDRINYDTADEFKVEASDDETEVSSIEVELQDSEGDEVETYSEDDCDSECTFEPDIVDELNHGEEYSVDIEVVDEVERSTDQEIDFTYDNQYEAGSSPSVSPSPGVFSEEPEEFDVELQGDGDEKSEVKVICRYEDGEELEETGYKDVSDGDTVDYTCEKSSFGIERKVSLEIEMVDEAGNSETYEVGEYLYDMNPPELGNLSAVVGVFNSDFEISYDAHDNKEIDGMDVSKLNYKIDDNTYDLDEGNNVSEIDGDFNIDTEGLEAGQHTVNVWAVDRAGRPSVRKEFEFDFKPDAEPSVDIDVPESVNVSAGDSKVFYANVTNDGDLFIGEMNLQVSSKVFNDSRELSDLKPGDSDEVMISADTGEEDLGRYTVNMSTESPDRSETMELVVEANNDQEDNITSKYNEYIEKYNVLKKNISSLEGKGLSDERADELDSNTSKFLSVMEKAKEAKQNGNLYMVKRQLGGVQTDFQKASQSYQEIKDQHELSERNETIGLFLLLFVGLTGGGVAYLAFFTEEYTLDKEAILERAEMLEGPVQTVQTTLEQYELTLEPIENVIEKVGELLAEEEEELEEAEEQAFQGFT